MRHATVLICTRNRAESLVLCVRSLLTNSSQPLEVLVIDQSDGSETEQALQALGTNPGLRYVRSATRGKGAGLNEGLRLTASEIVVLTDDDCEAPPDWANSMASELDAQPTAAVLFCSVVAGTHDKRTGYVPAYEPRTDRLLRSIYSARHGLGLGAGMAVRKRAVIELGGFDESFGPGARFGSGDDWDLALRALLAGWHVYSSHRISIAHHGFRTFADGRAHALRDWIAIGGLFAKPIRAGHLGTTVPAAWLFAQQALWPPLRDVLVLRRPAGGARISGFLRGFGRGLQTPVRVDHLLYKS